MPPLLHAKDHQKQRRKRRKRRKKGQSHSLTQFRLLRSINSKLGNIMLLLPQMEMSIKLTVWKVQSLQNHPSRLLLLQQRMVQLLRPHHQPQLLLPNKNGSNSKLAQVKTVKFHLIMKLLQMPLLPIAKALAATTTTQIPKCDYKREI
jgi:hypothetical protein